MIYTVQLYCFPSGSTFFSGSTCFSGSPGSIDSHGSTAMCFPAILMFALQSVILY